VRAVLLDPGGAVLLLRIVHPRSGRPWWLTPGGGIDDGEDHPTALRRELSEEIGLDLPAARIGPALWERFVRFNFGDRYTHQHETYYLVETDRFDPVSCQEGDPAEGMFPVESRWWTASELGSADANLAPTGLAGLLTDLVAQGPPATPVPIAP
jgi:8-oxo-dGTP pyrophosphatase MutT (NUDIX family)